MAVTQLPTVQDEIIDFLRCPGSHGHGIDRVDVIETHISQVFLVGDRAYKMKRAIVLPYLNYSSLPRRHQACQDEIQINRSTAPQLYLGLVPVVRQSDGQLCLGGSGETLEWLIEMVRFDQSGLFDQLASGRKIRRRTIEDLADVIADFHARAEPEFGGECTVELRRIIETNDRSFRKFGGDYWDATKIDQLRDVSLRALAVVADDLDKRASAGKIRRCHGDLHLGNIVMWEGRPTLFDAIEFDPRLATIDVAYDLSFVLMDLDERGFRRLSNILFNRYLAVTGDVGGLVGLKLYMSLRAAIRAHVRAAASNTAAQRDARAQMAHDAVAYFDLALKYHTPVAPSLIAVGGLSGSGKSRLARELAPHIGSSPGAYIARSDAIRKRITGVSINDRLPSMAYRPDMSQQTYDQLYIEAREALSAGYAVVADAVFARPTERQAIRQVADQLGVPFQGIWLEAAPDEMAHRISTRQRNISDATPDVLRQQLGYDLGPMEWQRIDSSGKRKVTLATALKFLTDRLATAGAPIAA